MNSSIETSAANVEAIESPVVATIELPSGREYRVTLSDLKRISDKAEVSEDGQHVLWKGAKTPDGYGKVHIGGHTMPVHRVVYLISRGQIPDELVLDHRCRIRHCCNPACLVPVTHAENILSGEGPTAINARKTHCKDGHEFTPENTLVTIRKGNGRTRRRCLACTAEYDRERNEVRRKVAA
ncbi:HNH endonuclease signature motif containing protein [Streptomyces sp. NPDC087437]|uniref:HNH endonuclease signature motif containing protein n=1 Tax=Streptomyces sp. NPDC087437 TaxID=3365789 RepID=UPI003820EE81